MKSKLSVLESTQGNASALMMCTFGDENDFWFSAVSIGWVENKPSHLRIEIDQGDAFDLRILENFADSQTVASAQHQYPAGSRDGRQSGMDQRFVIAVFVARTELQMAAEEQADVILESRQDDVLIAGVASEDDLVRIDVVFGRDRDALGLASPIPKPHSTTTHRIRRARTEASWLANRKVLHSATNTLMMPNNMAERTSPR